MIGAILEISSVLASLLGLFAAAKGASRTQSILQRGNQQDKLIDAMAWVDRNVLRTNTGH
jgi:hypothetical protein